MVLKVYSADEVHAALDFVPLADALATAFARGAEVPLRHVHRLGGGDVLLLMPAWRTGVDAGGGALGVKLVSVMPGAASRGAETVAATYLLLDRSTGKPRALLDGEALTLRRTAAASALAARYLARADAATLLIIGTGKLAPFMAKAHCALLPALARVFVWGRSRERALVVVSQLGAEGLPVELASDLETAVRGADLISCATTAQTPVLRGAWLAPGTHVDLVGGFTPAMREADDEAIVRARVVVDTYAGALAEAGDLTVPLENGVITRDDVVAELGELVRGEKRGRAHDDEITLFKSVGTALEDLAAAELVVRGR